MNDQLLNYIEENKAELDVYVPRKESWQLIQQKVRAQTSRRRNLRLLMSLAAAALVALLVKVVAFNGNETIDMNGSIAYVNTNAYVPAEKNTDPEWESQKTVDFKFSGRLRNVEPFTFNKIEPIGLSESYLVSMSSANATIASMDAISYSWSFSAATSGPSGPSCVSNYITSYHVAVTPAAPGFVPYTPSGLVTTISPPVYEDPYYGAGHYYEQYDEFEENKFEEPADKPLSTFGIDVDGASYSNMRRFINGGYLPPKDAVKIEEMINYFDYDFPEPTGEDPFSVTTELGQCPWNRDHQLMQIAIKGEEIDFSERKSNNLIFLIDVSGSMDSPEKLPLLKRSLNLLVEEMQPDDQVALVVYAGSSGLVLPPTSGENKGLIYEAIENLDAGGSTAGGEGIELAYQTAEASFLEEGNNRVILATDGDFNVGITNDDELIKLIEKKRETGVYLSVLGFGTGNLKDAKMEKLADNGNGNYSYIDNIMEAKKVLVNEIGGTLITIANDVKLQVEFNPDHVAGYRLLGYENRILQERDFEDDTKDAGDLGSGHEVIALYEIIPAADINASSTGLRYQDALKDELAIVKFRYKKPGSKTSKLTEAIVQNKIKTTNSSNFSFASAVAEFGLLIRDSEYKGTASYGKIIKRALANMGNDKNGYRKEFVELVKKAQELMYVYVQKRGGAICY
jgi:Ca-activated chloride channel homolog